MAAALVREYGIPTFSIKGEDDETYYRHLTAALDHQPQITLDDGADLVTIMHTQRSELLTNLIGGTEETTTGVIRLTAMAKDEKLAYPIIAVNEAETKHFFDNRYGTGQSTLDGITRATNVLGAGRRAVQVIPGKGLRPDGTPGGPRAAVPPWLNQPDLRERIVAFTHATPRDGGEGALYLLLKRKR